MTLKNGGRSKKTEGWTGPENKLPDCSLILRANWAQNAHSLTHTVQRGRNANYVPSLYRV